MAHLFLFSSPCLIHLLSVIPLGHYSCRNCNFTTITTNWFPQLAGRTFSFRLVSSFFVSSALQLCSKVIRIFWVGLREEGWLVGWWKDNFRLRHMHCKFILGRQLCHMMSLTVLRFICTVKSGNCTYVLAPSARPVPPQDVLIYFTSHLRHQLLCQVGFWPRNFRSRQSLSCA